MRGKKKTYSGKYRPKNPSKYLGDPSNIIYRSYWERATFKWLDENPNVVGWASEEVVVPYRCKTDGRAHRYFPDLVVRFKDGSTCLIEIKPDAQTREPKKPKKKPKSTYSQSRFLREVATYAKNISKWEAAQRYCEEKGWVFDIWTENTLTDMGIKLLLRGGKKPIRKKKLRRGGL